MSNVFSIKQGISHRDISLENVLLSGGDVRLMDFGQAVQARMETGMQTAEDSVELPFGHVHLGALEQLLLLVVNSDDPCVLRIRAPACF